MENQTKALIPIKSQITKLKVVVGALVIQDEESQKKAIDILSIIKGMAKIIKEHKDARLKPINDSLKLLRSDYAPLEAYCTEAEFLVKQKMIEYYKLTEAKRLEEERKLVARVENGNLKIETAAKKLEEMPEVKTHVSGEKGSVTIKKVKKFRIVDMSLLPIEFHLPDEVAIRAKMNEGVELPGVEYYEEEIVAAR